MLRIREWSIKDQLHHWAKEGLGDISLCCRLALDHIHDLEAQLEAQQHELANRDLQTPR